MTAALADVANDYRSSSLATSRHDIIASLQKCQLRFLAECHRSNRERALVASLVVWVYYVDAFFPVLFLSSSVTLNQGF